MIKSVDIEGMPEEERLALLKGLDAERPGSSSLAAGTLAGRATSGRPNVAIWDYQRYADDHSDVSIEDLVEVRFPVIFFGGQDFTIDSAAEYLRTDPVPTPRLPTVSEVINMWSALHAAGVVRWDEERRAVEHVRPSGEYRKVLREWHAGQGATSNRHRA